MGTAMSFDDSLWDRFAIGEDRKIVDPTSKAPARRNLYASKIAELTQRGLIALVCNVSMSGWARTLAEKTGTSFDAAYAEMKAHLVPGAIVVPSGIYALIRAQNAGCAMMAGT